jgi:hypothetical protein
MILLPLWMMFAVAGGALALLAGGACFLQWLVELARNTASDTGTLVYVSMAALVQSGKLAQAAKAKGVPTPAAADVSDLADDAMHLFDVMKKAERHLGQLRKMANGLRRARTWLGIGAVVLCTTAGLVALISAP